MEFGHESAVVAEPSGDARGTVIFRPFADRIGDADHHRIQNRRQQRNPDHDLIHGAFGIVGGGKIQKRHHIREFADLGERKTHLHRSLDALAGHDAAGKAVYAFADHDERRQTENNRQVFPARGGIDQQTDRHEKHRREHRPERLGERVQPAADIARRTENPDQERAERHGEIEPERDPGDKEAAPEQRQQERLVVMALGNRLQKPRHQHQTENDGREKEHEKPAERLADRRERRIAAGDAGYERDDADADYVFADGSADHVFRERPRRPFHLVDHFSEQSRRRVADRRAEKERFDRAPAQELRADGIAEIRHHHRIENRGRESDVLEFLHVRHRKLKPQREHEEHYAELPDRLDGIFIDKKRPAPCVAAHHNAGQNIADHFRPLEFGEYD